MHCCLLQDGSALKVAKQFTIWGWVAYKLDNYIINFWILRYLSQINWLINYETWFLSFLKKFVVATKHFQSFIYKTCFAKIKRSVLENVTQIRKLQIYIVRFFFFFFFSKSTFLCSFSFLFFPYQQIRLHQQFDDVDFRITHYHILSPKFSLHVTVEFSKCSNHIF